VEGANAQGEVTNTSMLTDFSCKNAKEENLLGELHIWENGIKIDNNLGLRM
jgi:hypothetical protein